jgi:hypothetical protein
MEFNKNMSNDLVIVEGSQNSYNTAKEEDRIDKSKLNMETNFSFRKMRIVIQEIETLSNLNVFPQPNFESLKREEIKEIHIDRASD